MENLRQTDTETKRIQDMLDRYLSSPNILKSSAAETSAHLDEDSLTAFAEGRLSQRETGPVATHLVACRFCRHKTAELIRLDLDLADVAETVSAEAHQPSRISAVLSDILSKMFGTTEGAVFAHEEKSESADKTTEDDKPDDDST